ncbi:hypothetical protein V8C42DRAFT_93646 [Trichoderma barbatum]
MYTWGGARSSTHLSSSTDPLGTLFARLLLLLLLLALLHRLWAPVAGTLAKSSRERKHGYTPLPLPSITPLCSNKAGASRSLCRPLLGAKGSMLRAVPMAALTVCLRCHQPCRFNPGVGGDWQQKAR